MMFVEQRIFVNVGEEIATDQIIHRNGDIIRVDDMVVDTKIVTFYFVPLGNVDCMRCFPISGVKRGIIGSIIRRDGFSGGVLAVSSLDELVRDTVYPGVYGEIIWFGGGRDRYYIRQWGKEV